MQISHKKERKRTQRSFYKVKRELNVLFSIYIYIYIHIYISIYIYKYIYIYLYISIEKRTQCSAFFCKRTKCSRFLLRSLQKNVAFFVFTIFAKERNMLLGFISRQKLEKERKRMLRSLKERKKTERSEWKRTLCPTLSKSIHPIVQSNTAWGWPGSPLKSLHKMLVHIEIVHMYFKKFRILFQGLQRRHWCWQNSVQC